MKTRTYRKLRLTVAFISFSLLSLAFLDLHGLVPDIITRPALYLQFVPSMLSYAGQGGSIFAGFILVLLLTLLAGRVYCSFLCPLGIYFDMAAFFKGKKRHRYSPPKNKTRYAVLLITVAALGSKTFLVLNFLDPFSNFGRGMTYIAAPLTVSANNLLAYVLEQFQIFTVSPLNMPVLNIDVLIFVGLFFFMVTLFAIKKGRLYCHTLCPVGTALGLLSRMSVLKVRIENSSCSQCRKCATRCTSECIDMQNGTVDMSRCVACFDCLTVCPSGSISFGTGIGNTKSGDKKSFSMDRRKLLASMVFLLPGISRSHASAPLPKEQKSTVPVVRKHPITPPGSGNRYNFSHACTACFLCVSACPSQVIQPKFVVYGSKGFFIMPSLDPEHGYCNHTCTRCGEVCPTGAISPLSMEEKQLTQIGKAVLVKANCIEILSKTACGACTEHCPTKAVTMVFENGQRLPRIDTETCIGCGACEHACPVKPFKAIYVEGNPVHGKAKPPAIKKALPVTGTGFPF